MVFTGGEGKQTQHTHAERFQIFYTSRQNIVDHVV